MFKYGSVFKDFIDSLLLLLFKVTEFVHIVTDTEI